MATRVCGTRDQSAKGIGLVLLVVVALTGCGSNPSPTPPSPMSTAQPSSAPTVAPTQTVDAGPDLAVWAMHDSPPGAGPVTYHVRYTNLSRAIPAHAVMLTINAPIGAQVAKLSRKSRPSADGGVEILLGTVEPAAIGVVDVDVTWATTPPLGAWTALRTSISTTDADPDSANNTATDGERVPAPNLALTMGPADTSGAFVPGATVAYALSYTNVSSAAAPAPSLTVTLPRGVTYVSAGGSLRGKVIPVAGDDGSRVALPLSAIKAMGSGDVELRVALAADLVPGQTVTSSAQITTEADTATADNEASSTDVVQTAGADVWVLIAAKGTREINSSLVYRVEYGNRGTAAAKDVRLTVNIPSSLSSPKFSIKPTAVANGTATWDIATLPSASGARLLEITATVAAAGPAGLRAAISSATADANTGNDAIATSIDLVALSMPVISGPVNAIVGARPVFFGTGKIGATVSLSLAGEDGQAGSLLGADTVDGNGTWEIRPTADIPGAGWHWFTATQQLGDLVSETAGVANISSADIATDPNSLTVNGKRVGGIAQQISWPGGTKLAFAATITTCKKVVSPILQTDYYNATGAIVNRQLVAPTGKVANGAVGFTFEVPRLTQEVAWQMSLAFFCDDAGQSGLRSGVQLASYTAGVLDWIERKIDCWFGTCPPEPPPPPPPPKPCQGCEPAKIPKKPAPNFMSEPDDKWAIGRWPTALPPLVT